MVVAKTIIVFGSRIVIVTNNIIILRNLVINLLFKVKKHVVFGVILR